MLCQLHYLVGQDFIFTKTSKTMARSKNYIPYQTEQYKISRSGIQLFLECPRCFYLRSRHGVSRVSGPPFSLNVAVDALLKKEFDYYRKRKEPHPYMVEYGIDAIPYETEHMDDWTYNFHGVIHQHEKFGFHLYGAVDDLWIDNKTGEIIVVDYKATSKDGEVSLDADWQIAYKNQMEIYQYLLRNNGLKVSDTGWFVYCNGVKANDEFNGKLDFDVKLISYTGNTDWIEPTLAKIKDCLDSEAIPNASESCKHCSYVIKYNLAVSDS